MSTINKLLKIASIQMVSDTNWQKNLIDAEELVAKAAQDGVRLVILPEFFIRIADTRNGAKLEDISEPLGTGIIQNRLSNLAKKHKIYLAAGTIPIYENKNNKPYNSMLIFDDSGNLICHYYKTHLFKLQHKSIGAIDESDVFTAGDNLAKFTLDGFTFGLAICYDLRFPELFRQMAGVDAFIIPAAFIAHTGPAHWEVLLRARAIENQCYIIASAQGGIHPGSGRHSYGHSMIINPWGEILTQLEYGVGIITATLDKEEISKVRAKLPALDSRRL